VNGGHIWPILAHLATRRADDPHAARAVVRLRRRRVRAHERRAGVLSVTAGCGLTNAVTGLCVAGLTGSPVVCIAGQHPTTEDQLGSFQEAYGAEICRRSPSSPKRVLDWTTIGSDLRIAFREAMSPPPGPTLVEIPTNVLYQQDDVATAARGRADLPARRAARAPAIPPPSSARSERSRAPSARSSSPATASSGPTRRPSCCDSRPPADPGLHAPARRRAPCSGGRPARGARRVEKPFTGGPTSSSRRLQVLERRALRRATRPWNADATYIQVDAAPARVGWHVPAEIPIVGDPKLVLRQLIDRRGRTSARATGRRLARARSRRAQRSSSSAARAGARSRRGPDPSRRA
jgi:acetolactate synthase-1/2/3 large subunit